jgi:hypothetical protein
MRKMKIVPPAVLGFVAVGVVPIIAASCGGAQKEMPPGVAAPAFTQPVSSGDGAVGPEMLGVAAPAFSNR